jgi:hypothetical protein
MPCYLLDGTGEVVDILPTRGRPGPGGRRIDVDNVYLFTISFFGSSNLR